MLESLIQPLAECQPLTAGQIHDAVRQLVDETVPPQTKADFLCALARKGEATEEIAAFARELREKSLQPPLDAATRAGEILDVCGTGGDRLNTFNISTAVALVVAAAGIKVAKHGNRAITSGCGSADVLEALGVRIDLEPEAAARSLGEHGFAFFFAQKYHPAFKHIGPARKLCAERGQRTIFNFLGPLLNPARPTAQLIGVPRPELCEPMARVLQALGVRRGMVVSGSIAPGESAVRSPKLSVEQSPEPAAAYLDEVSTIGETAVAEFYQDRGFATSLLCPTHFPVQDARIEDLTGGDPATNAGIIRRLFRGEERGPKRDALLLNAGAALFVAGAVKSIGEGWERAAEIIATGKAQEKLQELQK
jgi:anthranilate phosphoribosyltransferase